MSISRASMKAALAANTSDEDFVGEYADTDVNEDEVGMDRHTELKVKTQMTNASDYQIAMFEYLDDQLINYQSKQQTSSLAVQAVAGSGKTSAIVAASRLIPSHYKAAFLAFNKSIADELRTRLPRQVEAKTLNALGFGLLIPYLKGIGASSFQVRKNRTQAIIRKELTFAEQDAFGKDVGFLVNMCKSMGVVPVGCTDGVGIDGLTATDGVLNQICIHYQKAVDPMIRPTVYQKVREILAISFSDANIYDTQLIDYDDQKWLTVCKKPNGRTLAHPRYDVIILDEVQDVNKVDIELIKMVLKPNGIVIGVGDENQSIYGFRGADTKAFNTFKTSFNANTLPLSITYRCGKELVKHAQELVPSIQAAPDAPDGAVEQVTTWDAFTFQPQDLVLCRNNAPLIEFAYKLVAERVPVYVKGRNIGDGLIRIINDCVAEKIWVPNPNRAGKKMPKFTCDKARVVDLVAELQQWESTQIEMIRQEDPDNEDAIQRVSDQSTSIMVFVRANSDGKVSSVIEDIESLFSDDNREDAVVCATIHKAKGLEAERVFMYRSDCLYPPYVTPGSWAHDQEINLDYVARTRGKTYYGYLHGK